MSNRHPFKTIIKGLFVCALLAVAVLFCFLFFFSKAFCLALGNGVKLEMVKTPDNIWWGKYEVTQEQWTAVTGRRSPGGTYKQIAHDKPVLLANESEIEEFLKKLNALPSVKRRGLVFRLPDRSEWETACLAGSPGKWPLVAGGRDGTLDELAWYDGDLDESHPVGMKTPNAYGLYDMLGNVSERTTTKAYAPSYFPELPPELENWYAGGDMSFERADFQAGGRTGIARNCAYSFAGFRICASGRGYTAPKGKTTVREERTTGPVEESSQEETPVEVPVPVRVMPPSLPSAPGNGNREASGERARKATAEERSRSETAERGRRGVPPPVPTAPA
jgi:hypothetical protein